MKLLGSLFLIALGAAGAMAVQRLVLERAPAASTEPGVARNDPAPGSPPLVWLDGTLEEVTEGSMAIREGQGPLVELERAAAGATRVFRLEDERWTPLSGREASAVEAGRQVCVEALLDGPTLLALRVFLEAGCGPGRPVGG